MTAMRNAGGTGPFTILAVRGLFASPALLTAELAANAPVSSVLEVVFRGRLATPGTRTTPGSSWRSAPSDRSVGKASDPAVTRVDGETPHRVSRRLAAAPGTGFGASRR